MYLLAFMASHSEILRREGVTSLHSRLTERGLKIAVITVQKWADRDSIPNPYWQHLAELGVTTLDELAEAAAAQPDPDFGQDNAPLESEAANG